MLSHLRFHRRGPPSQPSSPNPDQQPPSPISAQSSHFPLDLSTPSLEARPQSSSAASLPPSLPPIARVTSTESEPHLDPADMLASVDARHPAAPPPQHRLESGFMGGRALEDYRRGIQVAPQPHADVGVEGDMAIRDDAATQRPRPIPFKSEIAMRPSQASPQPRHMASFTTPTELQKSSTTATGRRPAALRLPPDAPTTAAQAGSVEPQRGKKGLPFLKNPMSTLLLRRKNNQQVPDLLPLPLGGQQEEPTYDPRIRGTRFHDFGAPRRRSNAPSGGEPLTSRSPSHTDLASERGKASAALIDNLDHGAPSQPQRSYGSSASASASARSGSASGASQSVAHTPSNSSMKEAASDIPPRPGQLGPPVPPKDGQAQQRLPSHTKNQSVRGSPSVHSNRSRNISLSNKSSKDMLSSVPKHMKSTSSRFSFDMRGSAQQEQILEERHRQRELEKQTSDAAEPRDSRFDDFDEDAFDYDAMMDDDGLEERIPGVNADFDDEEEDFPAEAELDAVDKERDPDDDQDNFAGFVFQRSNPASSLASPGSAGLMPTPRDAEGKPIGFAMSKYSPNSQNSPLSSQFMSTPQNPDQEASGLGIQGVEATSLTSQEHDVISSNDATPLAKIPRTATGDDMYFDDGVIGFEDEFAEDLAAEPEWDAAPFDESIFDNNDTDQYGRPIAGAFAQAQSLRHNANQPSVKRESDMTSRFSAQSAVTQSTAHTSMSVDERQTHLNDHSKDDISTLQGSQDQEAEATQAAKRPTDTMAAYQAALAAAAHEAAASGKFQRASPPSGGLGTDSEEDGFPMEPESIDDFDDYGASFDDMDFDDAVIAEANASALANDSDGWYGQEFGFYAAPSNQHQSSANSNSTGSTDYHFANGGFFGPKGASDLDRSMSGRMVSREPNLTPITERSEYSNRNSVMSLIVPPFGPGTPSIQSPGLAQLAMMADRGDDQMSLSALMRLRSKAWGGSQVSLSSSREGSPKSERGELSSPWGPNMGGFPPSTGGHMRMNSLYSTVSRDSDPGSMSGSPTMTADTSAFAIPPRPVSGTAESSVDVLAGASFPPSLSSSQPHPLQTQFLSSTESEDTPDSAASMESSIDSTKSFDNGRASQGPSKRSGMGHRHNSSADSISYMMEEERGEKRWVVERRRTAESGQVEILGRELVEGGRI